MRIFTVMHVFLLFHYYKIAEAAETAELENELEDEVMVEEENLEAQFGTILRRQKEILLFAYFAKPNISTPTIHQT